MSKNNAELLNYEIKVTFQGDLLTFSELEMKSSKKEYHKIKAEILLI